MPREFPRHVRVAENIRRVLADHGRAGVPLYLVYGPAAPDQPQVLPELLTVRSLIDALERGRHTATVNEPSKESRS